MRVAGGGEGRHRDVVHLEVVRVVVATPLVGVGDDHVRTDAADDADQPPDGLVRVGSGKGLRVGFGGSVSGVGSGFGHTGVVVAEHDHFVVPDDLCRAAKLPGTHRGEVSVDLGAVHGRVEDVPCLTTRATDKDAVDTCGAAHRHRRRPLRGLVVGVRMDGEQAEFRLLEGLHGRSR